MNCMNTFKNQALLWSPLNSLKTFITANSDCSAFTSSVYQYISFHVTLSEIVEAEVLSTACCYFQVMHKHQTKKLESNIDPVPKRQYNLRRRKKTSANNSFSDKVLFSQFSLLLLFHPLFPLKTAFTCTCALLIFCCHHLSCNL